MHLTMTLAQFVCIFFITMMSVCMSYAFAVMHMNTPPTYILTFAIFAELLAALFGYFACQLALQEINQDLSGLDAAVFVVAFLIFCTIMTKGPNIWKRTVLKENNL